MIMSKGIILNRVVPFLFLQPMLFGWKRRRDYDMMKSDIRRMTYLRADPAGMYMQKWRMMI